MKFNYEFEEGNESDSEFFDQEISTSFIFDRSERAQLKNLRKWLKDMDITHAVTRMRDENGDKKYCIVVYKDNDEEDSLEKKSSSVKESPVDSEQIVLKEPSKKSKKKSKKKSQVASEPEE